MPDSGIPKSLQLELAQKPDPSSDVSSTPVLSSSASPPSGSASSELSLVQIPDIYSLSKSSSLLFPLTMSARIPAEPTYFISPEAYIPEAIPIIEKPDSLQMQRAQKRLRYQEVPPGYSLSAAYAPLLPHQIVFAAPTMSASGTAPAFLVPQHQFPGQPIDDERQDPRTSFVLSSLLRTSPATQDTTPSGSATTATTATTAATTTSASILTKSSATETKELTNGKTQEQDNQYIPPLTGISTESPSTDEEQKQP